MSLALRRAPLYYGWVIVAAGILGNATSAGFIFWATAVYIPAVSDGLAVGRFPVVAAFVAGQAVSAAVGPVAGAYMDRHGARRALLIGAVVAPAGLVAASFATELWHLYAAWAVVGVGRPFLLPTTYNWLATRWFERRRQSALGLVTVGLGIGGVLLPLIAAIEAAVGWQGTMRLTGVVLALVQGLTAALVVRDAPRELGLPMEGGGAAGAASPGVALTGFTLADAMRGPTFWLIASGMALFFMGQGAVNVLGVDFFDSRGVAGGATILGVAAAIRAGGRLPVGLLLSRIHRVYALAVVVALSQALALAVVIPGTSRPEVIAFIALWGGGGIFVPMIDALLLTRAFGVRHYGAISGAALGIAFGGQLIAPTAGSALFDATQSYTPAFTLYSTVSAAAALLFAGAALTARGTPHRRRAAALGMGASGTADAQAGRRPPRPAEGTRLGLGPFVRGPRRRFAPALAVGDPGRVRLPGRVLVGPEALLEGVEGRAQGRRRRDPGRHARGGGGGAAQLLLVLARVAGGLAQRLLGERARRVGGVARPPGDPLRVRPRRLRGPARLIARPPRGLLDMRPRRLRGPARLVARPPRGLLDVRPRRFRGPARLVARPPRGLLDVRPRRLRGGVRRLLRGPGELPEHVSERAAPGGGVRLVPGRALLRAARLRALRARAHLAAPSPPPVSPPSRAAAPRSARR